MNAVIPTRFTNAGLWPLVEALNAANIRTVLVHTEPGHDDVPNVVNVREYARNIHSWWNVGLDECSGAALILNDDIVGDPKAFTALLNALEHADLVTLPKGYGNTPLSGWCFGIHPDGNLRPDPEFIWFYGEDDIWYRAVRDGAKIVTVDVPVIHERDDAPIVPDEFRQAVRADRQLFMLRWR